MNSRADLDAASAALIDASIEHAEVTHLPGDVIAIPSVQDPDDVNLELWAPLS